MDQSTTTIAFLCGCLFGGMGSFFILWVMYPWLAARTINTVLKQMKDDENGGGGGGGSDPKPDPADYWKPKGWSLDRYNKVWNN